MVLPLGSCCQASSQDVERHYSSSIHTILTSFLAAAEVDYLNHIGNHCNSNYCVTILDHYFDTDYCYSSCGSCSTAHQGCSNCFIGKLVSFARWSPRFSLDLVVLAGRSCKDQCSFPFIYYK